MWLTKIAHQFNFKIKLKHWTSYNPITLTKAKKQNCLIKVTHKGRDNLLCLKSVQQVAMALLIKLKFKQFDLLLGFMNYDYYSLFDYLLFWYLTGSFGQSQKFTEDVFGKFQKQSRMRAMWLFISSLQKEIEV